MYLVHRDPGMVLAMKIAVHCFGGGARDRPWKVFIDGYILRDMRGHKRRFASRKAAFAAGRYAMCGARIDAMALCLYKAAVAAVVYKVVPIAIRRDIVKYRVRPDIALGIMSMPGAGSAGMSTRVALDKCEEHGLHPHKTLMALEKMWEMRGRLMVT